MRGESVTDLQLLDMERTLRRELGGGDLHLNETNIRAAYRDENLEVDSLLEFLRYLLDLEGLPAYKDIVTRQFSDYITRQAFNADQIPSCGQCKTFSCKDSAWNWPICTTRR
jgi:type I restriction enzyme R subunit